MFGAAAVLSFGTHVELTATAVGGALTANTSVAGDQHFAAAEFRAALVPEPWLAFSAGVSVMGFDTPVARQRWGAGRIGAELRFPFVAGGLSAMVRAELLPVVSVTALASPQRAYAATSGLTWEGGRLVASLTYALERYDFPPAQSRSLMASVAGPTRSSIVRARRGAPDGRGGRSPSLERLISRCSLIRPVAPMDANGISQVSWRSVPCLCPAPRPRPSQQGLAFGGLVDAAPGQPKPKASAGTLYRG